MNAGDVLAVSKYLGIEGTSIIAHEKKEVKEILSKEEYELAKALSKEISVLKESKIAGKYGVKHMHDITEGGLLVQCGKLLKPLAMELEFLMIQFHY